MKILNNKGYMLVEIILASVIAFSVAYFIVNLTIKLKNKNDDLLVSTQAVTDQDIITNKLMKYATLEGSDFDCSKLSVSGKKIKYNGDVIDILNDYAVTEKIDSSNITNYCTNDNGKISITIPLRISQMPDKVFDVKVDYKYELSAITVKYDCTEGVGNISDSLVFYGAKYTLANNECSRDGYKQVKWVDPAGNKWNLGQTINKWEYKDGDVGITDNVWTLKAEWEKIDIFSFKYTGQYRICYGTNYKMCETKTNAKHTINIFPWKLYLLTGTGDSDTGTLTVYDLSSNADVFLVGGGGGGAQPYSTHFAGGGGAGGYAKTVKNIKFNTGDYSVKIGAGGAAGVGTSSNKEGAGGTGGTTTVSNCSDCSAAGGTGGSRFRGGNGGSGGGGGSYTTGRWYPVGACYDVGASTYTFNIDVVRSLGGYNGASGQKGGTNWGDLQPNAEIGTYTDSGSCGISLGTYGGTGANQSTREFGESNGKLYAGGGNGACRFYARYTNGTSGIPIVTKSPENATNCDYMAFNGTNVVCTTEPDGGAESSSSAAANTGGGGGGGVYSPDSYMCGKNGQSACGDSISREAGNGGSGIVVIRNSN